MLGISRKKVIINGLELDVMNIDGQLYIKNHVDPNFTGYLEEKCFDRYFIEVVRKTFKGTL